MVTAKELYYSACEKLKENEPNVYAFEVSQLLKSVCGFGREYLPVHGDRELSAQQVEKFNLLLSRRLNKEPLQYILGSWEFYGITVSVGEGVLIPRADTEIIADKAIKLIKENGYKICADLCSGSGAIALAMHEHTDAEEIYAVELSSKAYTYMLQNFATNSADRIKPILADVLTVELPMLDLVVSNPPYIPTEDIPSLEEEVHHEPMLALDGGEDGLHFYREISKLYYNKINSGGAIVFEVGIDLHESVKNILRDCGYTDIGHENDLCDIPRAVYGFKY